MKKSPSNQFLPRRGILATFLTTASLIACLSMPLQAHSGHEHETPSTGNGKDDDKGNGKDDGKGNGKDDDKDDNKGNGKDDDKGNGKDDNKGKPAKNTVRNLTIIPSNVSISQVNGQWVATGTASALVKGRTVTAPFQVPVTLALAADQTGAMPGCRILDLRLGEINLNLLGLIVNTSPICLELEGMPGDGQLLGNLLCGVANLLNGGLSLEQIIAGNSIPAAGDVLGVPAVEGAAVLPALNSLVNGALAQLANAALVDVRHLKGRDCAILSLELGPVDLDLLGLVVGLDDCAGGPVTVDITARKGFLLGNLLCQLVDKKKTPPFTRLLGLIAGVQRQSDSRNK